MNPSLPCYKRGVFDAPNRGALLPPDRFSSYRNSEIAKLGLLREQIFQRAVLFPLSGYVCYRSCQLFDSEKSLWSISVQTTLVVSGFISFFSFSTGLQKYFEYVTARQALAQKIEAYPKHFQMKEKCAIDRLITPEEFREISPYLPIGIESLEIFSHQVREWKIEGGEVRFGTFTPLKAKGIQVIESDEEPLFAKNRPWIDLTLFVARSQLIPNETKEELIRVVFDLIAPGQFFSAIRLERESKEKIRFFSRQIEREKVVFAHVGDTTFQFSSAEELKAFLMQKYYQ